MLDIYDNLGFLVPASNLLKHEQLKFFEIQVLLFCFLHLSRAIISILNMAPRVSFTIRILTACYEQVAS